MLDIGVGIVQIDWNTHDEQIEIDSVAQLEPDRFQKNLYKLLSKKTT